MDNLGILIKAILSLKDTTDSKKQIAKELPKLESQLQYDKNTRIKIVAGLDIAKSKNLIQTQLNTLANQAKAPTIKVGIDTSGLNSVQGATQNITNGLKSIQVQAQQTAKSIHDISTQTQNFKFPVVEMQDKEGNTITDTVKTLQNARDMFSKLGFTNVKFTWVDEAGGVFDRLTAKVTDSYGAVQNFKFSLLQGSNNYTYDGASGTDSGVEKLITSMQKAQDKVKALRTNLTADLKSIRSAWEDVNGGKSVKSDENIEILKQQYIKTAQAIRELRKADDTTLASMKANADAQIDKLRQMVTQYHNAEKVATQLRAKGFETVKIDTGNNIDKFVNSINNSKVPIQAMQTEINKLTSDFAQLDTIQDQAGKSASLTNILNTLDNAKTKFQSLKELFKGFGDADWLSVNSEQINKINDMATKIAIYKNNLIATRDEWKSQGIYVGEIQAKVTSLARSLPNIKKPEKFNEWVQEWNDINQKANQFKVNLDSQVATHNKIYEIQSQIVKLNPTKDGAEIARLNEKLSAEQKTLSNLQMQSNVYSNLVSLEQQEQYITEQTVKSRDKLLSSTNTGIKQYQASISSAISELQGVINSSTFTKNSSNSQVTQTKQEISSLITAYQNLMNKLQGNITPVGLESVRTELTELNARFNSAYTSAKKFETELKNDNGAEKLAQKVDLLTSRIKAYQTANSKANKTYGSQFAEMLNQLNNPNIDNEAYNRIAKHFQIIRQEINTTGKAGKTFFQTLGDQAKKFASWMTLTGVIASVWREMRKMVTNVIELDKAMTNLKKVTDETEFTYSNFLKTASQQAKEFHSTVTDLIEQTSQWAKLGYNLEQANELAKASMIYSNVGEVDNEQSVTNIVSAVKAFDVAVSDIMSIPDVYNKLGNEFAVSSKNLGVGMAQAATTMAMAGNDFNQVAALLTGAGEILGDNKLDEIGNGLKTVTLRIQNQAGALKELGEEYEDLISVSKTQQQVYELTGGKVNIMSATNPNEFRDTYSILKDVALVIKDLNDTDASELIQLLFGKHRANVGTAVLKAFQSGQIDKAYEAAKNSAGSAQKEFDAWSQSIEAKYVPRYIEIYSKKIFNCR